MAVCDLPLQPGVHLLPDRVLPADRRSPRARPRSDGGGGRRRRASWASAWSASPAASRSCCPGFPELLAEIGEMLPTLALTNATLFNERMVERVAAAGGCRRRPPDLARLRPADPQRRVPRPGQLREGAGRDPQADRPRHPRPDRDDRPGPDARRAPRLCVLHRGLGISDDDHVVRSVVGAAARTTEDMGARAGPDRRPARADADRRRRVHAPLRADRPPRPHRPRPAGVPADPPAGAPDAPVPAAAAGLPVGRATSSATSGEHERSSPPVGGPASGSRSGPAGDRGHPGAQRGGRDRRRGRGAPRTSGGRRRSWSTAAPAIAPRSAPPGPEPASSSSRAPATAGRA